MRIWPVIWKHDVYTTATFGDRLFCVDARVYGIVDPITTKIHVTMTEIRKERERIARFGRSILRELIPSQRVVRCDWACVNVETGELML